MSEYKLIHDDCVKAMRGMADNSVDSVVTDAPYGLGKTPDISEYKPFSPRAICVVCHRRLVAIVRSSWSGEVHVPWHKQKGKTCWGYLCAAVDAAELDMARKVGIPPNVLIEYRQSIDSDYFFERNEQWWDKFNAMAAAWENI